MSNLKKVVVAVSMVAILAPVAIYSARLARADSLKVPRVHARRNDPSWSHILLALSVAVILLGCMTALIVQRQQPRAAASVPLDADGQLDAAESLGGSLGTWQYVVLAGFPVTDTDRQVFTGALLEYARKLDVPLTIHELNKANTPASDSISQQVAKHIQEKRGSQARALLELRRASTYAELAIDSASLFDVSTGHMFTLLAANLIEIAAGEAEKAGIDPSIVDEGKSIADKVRHIETQTPFLREQTIHSIFIWEQEARYAMRGVAP